MQSETAIKHRRRDGHPSTMLRPAAARASFEARRTPDAPSRIRAESRVNDAFHGASCASGPGRESSNEETTVVTCDPPSCARGCSPRRATARPDPLTPLPSIERCAPSRMIVREESTLSDRPRSPLFVLPRDRLHDALDPGRLPSDEGTGALLRGLAMGTFGAAISPCGSIHGGTFDFPDLGRVRD